MNRIRPLKSQRAACAATKYNHLCILPLGAFQISFEERWHFFVELSAHNIKILGHSGSKINGLTDVKISVIHFRRKNCLQHWAALYRRFGGVALEKNLIQMIAKIGVWC